MDALDHDIATILVDVEDMELVDSVLSLDIEASQDEGATWVRIGRGSWTGGPQTQKNSVTSEWRLMVDQLPRHRGRLLRGVLTLQPRRSVGLSMTV